MRHNEHTTNREMMEEDSGSRLYLHAGIGFHVYKNIQRCIRKKHTEKSVTRISTQRILPYNQIYSRLIHLRSISVFSTTQITSLLWYLELQKLPLQIYEQLLLDIPVALNQLSLLARHG